MRNLVTAVAVVGCLSLGACGGVAPAVLSGISTASGIGSFFQTVNTAVSATSTTLDAVCRNYKTVEGDVNTVAPALPASVQSDIRDVEAYGDTACQNPPPGDMAGTALWFGNLIDQLKNLSVTRSNP